MPAITDDSGAGANIILVAGPTRCNNAPPTRSTQRMVRSRSRLPYAIPLLLLAASGCGSSAIPEADRSEGGSATATASPTSAALLEEAPVPVVAPPVDRTWVRDSDEEAGDPNLFAYRSEEAPSDESAGEDVVTEILGSAEDGMTSLGYRVTERNGPEWFRNAPYGADYFVASIRFVNGTAKVDVGVAFLPEGPAHPGTEMKYFVHVAGTA